MHQVGRIRDSRPGDPPRDVTPSVYRGYTEATDRGVVVITIKADGPLEQMDARAFLDVATELLKAAQFIASAGAPDDASTPEWRLAALSTGSAVFGAASTIPHYEELVVNELQNVTADESTPTVLSSEKIRALLRVRSRAAAGDLGQVSVGRGDNVIPLDARAAAVLEARLASYVQSIGAVVGRLEVARVPEDGEWWVNVHPAGARSAIRCYLAKDDERLFEAARSALRRTVRVVGRLSRAGINGPIQEVRAVRSITIVETRGSITDGFGHGPSSTGISEIREQRGG